MPGLKKLFLNGLLDRFPTNTKQRLAGILSKYATILAESGFCSLAEFDLNGEEQILKNRPVPLLRAIDGGANKGDWSSILLDTNPGIESFVMVEPNPGLGKHLKGRFGSDPRITILNKALDYRQDTLAFSYTSDDDEHATLGSQYMPEVSNEATTVPTTTVDDILDGLDWPSVDLLKLDLEGFDYFAMLGARDAFASNRVSMVQFEVTRSWEDTGASPCAAFRFLEGYGFQLYHIREDGLHPLPLGMPHFSIYSNFLGIHRSAGKAQVDHA